MTILNINLDFNSKACVWIKDSPSIIYPAIDILTKEIQTGLAHQSGIRQAVLELIIPVGPRVCYGLLGTEFIPNDSEKLSLEVRISTENESIFKDSMAGLVDTVRIGLPREYAQSVMEGIISSLNHQVIETLGAGVIRLEQAAHGEISSSQKMFRQMAATTIQLLLLDQVSSQEDVTEIVKTCSSVSR